MMPSNRMILVLGCGPAGLIAAHAIREEFGFNVTIISKKRRSQLFGCQYLHEPIPGDWWSADGGHPVMVDYQLVGTAEGYARKVYGEDPPGQVSPQLFTGKRPAWDIRATYRGLWERFKYSIVDYEIDARDIEIMSDFYRADFTISSIPARVLCTQRAKHEFKSVPCWAIGDAPGQEAPRIAPDNTVICDGTSDHGYYRASNVFGYSTVEWPGIRKTPPVEGVVQFEKPISTNCDCFRGVHRVGRMGTWTKGVLAHQVYSSTRNWIQAQLDYGQEEAAADE